MANTTREIRLVVSADELDLLCDVVGTHVHGEASDVGAALRRHLEMTRGESRRARAYGYRATVIRVDGTQSVEEFAGEPPLEWLQREVGGYVQLVTVGEVRVVCNEDAELIGLPVNEFAATELGSVPGARRGMLRGNVVLLERAE